MPEPNPQFGPLDLLPLVARTIADELERRREPDCLTGQLNRAAARERFLWIAAALKSVQVALQLMCPSTTRNAGQAKTDPIDKIFERELESFLRRGK